MAGFKNIIGHERTIEHLQKAIQMNKVNHAYLLQGERGSGKKTMAAAFAQTLQCEAGGTDSCGQCHSCIQAQSKNHPDIIMVTHEKPSTIGVDEIRQQVVEDMAIRPYNGKYKIYIVPDADKMTLQAQNALLKTLEEPPEYGVILLLAENTDSLLETIRSRCVCLNLQPVRSSQLKSYLMEKLHVPDYQAEISVAFAQGNVGKALKLATSEEFLSIKASALHLLAHAKQLDLNELANLVKDITQYKIAIDDYLDILAVWYRDVLVFKATRSVDSIIFRDQFSDIRNAAAVSSYEGIEEILGAIEKAKARLKANVSFELTMELLFLTMKEN